LVPNAPGKPFFDSGGEELKLDPVSDISQGQMGVFEEGPELSFGLEAFPLDLGQFDAHLPVGYDDPHFGCLPQDPEPIEQFSERLFLESFVLRSVRGRHRLRSGLGGNLGNCPTELSGSDGP
jgi:hypothetical protein